MDDTGSPPSNFIREIILSDNASGKYGKIGSAPASRRSRMAIYTSGTPKASS